MSANSAARQISAKYDRFAHWYDGVDGIAELMGLRRLRPRLVQQATGKVLEVAIGTGKNLPYYSRQSGIIGVDLSRWMLNIARKRTAELSILVFFSMTDAQALPFADKSFDTVVSSLSTCTFPDPVAALKEMARVCRPAGKLLLVEHGRSDQEWLGRWQDRHADKFAESLGCHWNREPLELTSEAGLQVAKSRRCFFGVFHQIEAEPDPPLIREVGED
jgi:ubiquinone/menaquinone biosynthesis C-methylase UbiE